MTFNKTKPGPTEAEPVLKGDWDLAENAVPGPSIEFIGKPEIADEPTTAPASITAELDLAFEHDAGLAKDVEALAELLAPILRAVDAPSVFNPGPPVDTDSAMLNRLREHNGDTGKARDRLRSIINRVQL